MDPSGSPPLYECACATQNDEDVVQIGKQFLLLELSLKVHEVREQLQATSTVGPAGLSYIPAMSQV